MNNFNQFQGEDREVKDAEKKQWTIAICNTCMRRLGRGHVAQFCTDGNA